MEVEEEVEVEEEEGKKELETRVGEGGRSGQG